DHSPHQSQGEKNRTNAQAIAAHRVSPSNNGRAETEQSDRKYRERNLEHPGIEPKGDENSYSDAESEQAVKKITATGKNRPGPENNQPKDWKRIEFDVFPHIRDAA